MVFILTAFSPFNVVANRCRCYSVVQIALISEIVIHTRHMFYNVVTSFARDCGWWTLGANKCASPFYYRHWGRSMFMTTFYDWQGHTKGPLCLWFRWDPGTNSKYWMTSTTLQWAGTPEIWTDQKGFCRREKLSWGQWKLTGKLLKSSQWRWH